MGHGGGGGGRSGRESLRAVTLQLRSLIYTVTLFPNVPCPLPTTGVTPPGFSPCFPGGDGRGYYILTKRNSSL